MVQIRQKVINGAYLVENILISLTEQLTGIRFRIMDFKPIEKNFVIFLVHTHGYFESDVYFYIEDTLRDKLVKELGKGWIPNDEEDILCITEYLNVVCGRGISEVNNTLKEHSRITVPILLKEIDIKSQYEKKITVSCDSLYGRMNIVTYYSNEMKERHQ